MFSLTPSTRAFGLSLNSRTVIPSLAAMLLTISPDLTPMLGTTNVILKFSAPNQSRAGIATSVVLETWRTMDLSIDMRYQ